MTTGSSCFGPDGYKLTRRGGGSPSSDCMNNGGDRQSGRRARISGGRTPDRRCTGRAMSNMPSTTFPQQSVASTGLRIVHGLRQRGGLSSTAPDVLWELGAEVDPDGGGAEWLQHQPRVRLDAGPRPHARQGARARVPISGSALDGDADRVVIDRRAADGSPMAISSWRSIATSLGPTMGLLSRQRHRRHGDVQSWPRALP